MPDGKPGEDASGYRIAIIIIYYVGEYAFISSFVCGRIFGVAEFKILYSHNNQLMETGI